MRTLTLSLVILLFASITWADKPSGLTAEEKKQGFVSMFDGKTLAGWQGNTKGYEAQDGLLVCNKKGAGFLYTDKEYGDFSFRFEFKLTPGANNGIGIRTPMPANPAYAGMEIQILDDTAKKYSKLKEYQYHGSIYGVVPAKRGYQKPVGEWNSQEIICKGNQVTVILNGETIVDADIIKASTPKTLDGKKHAGLKREKGYIVFCGHGADLQFRNIRIKVMDK